MNNFKIFIDSDDEREDTPEVERVQRKRKRSESKLAVTKVVQSIDISCKKEEEGNGTESDGSTSPSTTDSETVATKFRRGDF